MGTNDSSDRMPAVPSPSASTHQLLLNVLDGMNRLSREMGAMREGIQSMHQRLDDHREARDRDDEDIKEKHKDFEDRIRKLEEGKAAKTDLATTNGKVEALSSWKMWVVGAAAGGGAVVAFLWKLLDTASHH